MCELVSLGFSPVGIGVLFDAWRGLLGLGGVSLLAAEPERIAPGFLPTGGFVDDLFLGILSPLLPPMGTRRLPSETVAAGIVSKWETFSKLGTAEIFSKLETAGIFSKWVAAGMYSRCALFDAQGDKL